MMFIVSIIKKLFSSVVSVVIFLVLIYVVIKYQLYSPEKIGKYVDMGTRLFDRITHRVSGGKNQFGLSDYGITVEVLPRGQSKYLVVLINNVGNNTSLDKVVSAVKVLDCPVLIGLNGVSGDEVSSLNSALAGYKVSYGLVIPDEKLGSYDDVRSYVTDSLMKYSSVVNINTLIVSSVSEAVSRFAVLNNMVVVKLDNEFGMKKLKVGGEVTEDYYFKSLYYGDITEEDAPIIKEKIKNMVQDKNGVLVIGFDANYLSSESVKNNEGGDNSSYVSKSRLIQDAIINPIVELYYGSSYKFYDGNFDDYVEFLSNVVKVARYFDESNVVINSDKYGTKIEVPMGVYPAFVTIKVPKEIGLIKVQKLATVNLYYMSNTKVDSDKYHKQEVTDGVLIYPLDDLKNVKMVITYVSSSE